MRGHCFTTTVLCVIVACITPLTVYNTVSIRSLQQITSNDIDAPVNCAYKKTSDDCRDIFWCKWDDDKNSCVRRWLRKMESDEN